MTMDMNVGHNLRKIRESLGLDIVDVSIETGYSESHLAQLERDKRKPSFDCMIDLMSYYDCEPNEIFGVESANSDMSKDKTYEYRLDKLPFKDKKRAIKTIEAILKAFEEVD